MYYKHMHLLLMLYHENVLYLESLNTSYLKLIKFKLSIFSIYMVKIITMSMTPFLKMSIKCSSTPITEISYIKERI